MRTAIFLFFLFTLASTHAAPRCEITGDAQHWAYDACFWRYGTDDALHPDVMSCVDRDNALISKVGSCQAKRIFKGPICRIARDLQLKDPDPAKCMATDKPLGSAVRNGGI